MARQYVVDIAGGTATATVQIQQSQTFKRLDLTWVNAAAGKIELSLSSASQIGTAQPDSNVLARVSCSAGANTAYASIPLPSGVSLKPFNNIYVHCTGTGNLGTAVIQ
jgi:hypothetical protein